MNSTNLDTTEHLSPFGFDQTLARLRQSIEKAGMTIFAEIDHAAGARQAGMAMPATVVLLYGNPKGGTPIMLASPAAALDLPLRVLVRAVDAEHASISFHPIAPVLTDAGVPEALAKTLEPAQRLLIQAIRT
jgi:uncharacterized protein (DUF302 family)